MTPTWAINASPKPDIKSMMKLKGSLSSPFEESMGIRQGEVCVTSIFKDRANPDLPNMDDHLSSLRIGHISMGALIVANDLALSSGSVGGITGPCH